MSWDAYLTDDRGHSDGEWNYTHNTNKMIAAAFEDACGETTEQCGGPLGPAIGPAWWKRLDGKSGPEGAAYLTQIINALEANPEKFRDMNPENGWGDYNGVLATLASMRDAVPEWPTVWSVHG